MLPLRLELFCLGSSLFVCLFGLSFVGWLVDQDPCPQDVREALEAAKGSLPARPGVGVEKLPVEEVGVEVGLLFCDVSVLLSEPCLFLSRSSHLMFSYCFILCSCLIGL